MAEHYKLVVHSEFDNPAMKLANVFYVQYASPVAFDAANLHTIANSFYAGLLTSISSHFRITSVGVQRWEGPASGIWWADDADPPHPLKNPPWGVEQVYNVTPIVGLSLDELLPPQVAAFMYAKTNHKHVIARKFIPGYVEETQAGGRLLADPYADLQGAAVAWATFGQVAFGPNPVPEVWGYKYGFQTLTSFVASDILATNRRRKIGRGS